MKKIMIFCLLIIEGIIFGVYCTVTSGGFKDIYNLHLVAKNLSEEINALHLKKEILKKEKRDWEAYPFYKEQIAREQLHLYHPDETVIIFDHYDE